MSDDGKYQHERILQLCPIHGAYYAVWADTGEDPGWFKVRVPVLALVERWRADSVEEMTAPPRGAVVTRTVVPVEFGEGYFETSDTERSSNLLGFYFREDLDDPDIIAGLNARASDYRAKIEERRRGAKEKAMT